jgi:DNA-binding transcriptional ArsR family regulator
METTVDVELGAIFGALADPTRRRLVQLLGSGEATVGELAERFDTNLPAISKHLSVLERAGIISRHKEAQWRRCRLQAEPFARLREWADHYAELWGGSLDRLESYLEKSGPRDRARPVGRT